MCDLNPRGTRGSLPRTFFNGAWLSRCSRLLTGRRDGFQALLWAAVVNLILFGLFLACATFVYETNDDLMMQMIASGLTPAIPTRIWSSPMF